MRNWPTDPQFETTSFPKTFIYGAERRVSRGGAGMPRRLARCVAQVMREFAR
jgi:hypothetical protein